MIDSFFDLGGGREFLPVVPLPVRLYINFWFFGLFEWFFFNLRLSLFLLVLELKFEVRVEVLTDSYLVIRNVDIFLVLLFVLIFLLLHVSILSLLTSFVGSFEIDGRPEKNVGAVVRFAFSRHMDHQS